MSTRTLLLLLVACVVVHALSIADHAKMARKDHTGRDYATYYYAVDVAWAGGDPYDKAALGAAAREDGTRKGVHPFFYPPPYLLSMAWATAFDLHTSYLLWFALDELFLLAVLLALAAWWGPLDERVGPLLLLVLGVMTFLPNNHVMGQMNLPVLFVTVLGLWWADRRPVLAGALLGLACMWKMAPAFFVAWWILRRRWVAVGSSIATAVVLSIASLPLVGFDVQWRFFTEVLPAFGSGRYNGLGVGINLFGNHSIPNLYDDWFPAGPAHLILSDTARILSTTTMLAVVAVTGWAFRRAPSDRLAEAGQIGAVAAAMLLVPVITYEHHLVWAIPGLVIATVGALRGRLARGWIVPLGLAWAALGFELATLKELWIYLRGDWPLIGWILRELKFGGVVVVYAACIALGRSGGKAGS